MEKKKAMQIEGYPIEGLSIGGHETCIIFPSLRIAFDIGRCPHRAISQDFLFISHSHMDHIVSIIFLNLLKKKLKLSDWVCNDRSLTLNFESNFDKPLLSHHVFILISLLLCYCYGCHILKL